MAVTIKDIAAVAKVSRGTVDRVLNNRGSVKPEVEERVRMVAASMGYKPNAAAKAFSTLKKKMVFGILLPSVGDLFFVDLIEGIREAQRELEDYGVKIILKETSGYDVDRQLEEIDELLAQGITALGLLPLMDRKVAEKIDSIVDSGIPVVTINSDIEDSKRNLYVGTDFKKSGNLAAGLMGLINPRAQVLILTGSSKLLSHNLRISGFSETIGKRFPEISVIEVVECRNNNFTAYEAVKKSIEDHPEMDALYITAEGIKGACEAVSLYPERRINIICFDDVDYVKQFIKEGKISATICQQPRRQGYEAVKNMFAWFAYPEVLNQESILMEGVIKICENI